jgi:hypothetical protein
LIHLKRTGSALLMALILLAIFAASTPITADGVWTTVNIDGNSGYPTSLALDSSGNPRFSYYGGSDLKYASWNATAWSIRTVDSTGDVGYYSSLAINSANNPCISYYDNTNGDLKYASWNGTAWATTTVDSTGRVGLYTSLALDPSGKPRISYYDNTNGDLKYASWNGTAWALKTVDSTGRVGLFTSLALDPSGNPGISYYDETNYDLKYASWNGTAWTTKMVVDSTGIESVGYYSSLAFDSSGNPHISYYETEEMNLIFASWNSTAWTKETVDSNAGGQGSGLSLALDSSDNPHISYRDRSTSDLKYASWNDTEWIIETADSNRYGYYSSLALDSSGNPHISYSYNSVKYASRPSISYPLYLAEGTSAWGFSTYISVQNHNNTAVKVKLTYMTPAGSKKGPTISMPAKSQATINPVDTVGTADFSTKVECLGGKTIFADRTMIWNAGAGEEAHCSVAVTAPDTTWYLPEGCSNYGFETWLLIQNPNKEEATCEVTYMIEGEYPETVTHEVPAYSRASFSMADDIGAADASIQVESDIPVIPERAVYRNNRREGHDSIGTTAPATYYYLAEGTTAWGFTTYVLLQNPNDSDTDVTVTYMTANGAKPQDPITLPANSRKTIRVNDVLPNTDFSTKVTGSKPIIAERAMYWNNGTGEACHDSIGMATAHKSFYLPDGQSSNGRETWTLVQNPNDNAVKVTFTYMTATGKGNVTRTETVAANSRKTFNMAQHSGINGRAAIMVTSQTAGKNIMVERAMYWNSRGAGTDTIGGYSN